MKTRGRFPHCRAYLMIECLVYLSVIVILLGAMFVMFYRCVDSSVGLRRNADDITSALHAGERWRADVRASTGMLIVQADTEGAILRIPNGKGDVCYRFLTNAILRRVSSGTWTCVLSNVKNFQMESDPRQNVTCWRWELELEPRRKGQVTRLRPLFTFTAVPFQFQAQAN
jgi:hypothetical protein